MQMSQLELQNLFNGPNEAHLLLLLHPYNCRAICMSRPHSRTHTTSPKTHKSDTKKILGIFVKIESFCYTSQFILLCNVIVTLSCLSYVFVFVISKFTTAVVRYHQHYITFTVTHNECLNTSKTRSTRRVIIFFLIVIFEIHTATWDAWQ